MAKGMRLPSTAQEEASRRCGHAPHLTSARAHRLPKEALAQTPTPDNVLQRSLGYYHEPSVFDAPAPSPSPGLQHYCCRLRHPTFLASQLDTISCTSGATSTPQGRAPPTVQEPDGDDGEDEGEFYLSYLQMPSPQWGTAMLSTECDEVVEPVALPRRALTPAARRPPPVPRTAAQTWPPTKKDPHVMKWIRQTARANHFENGTMSSVASQSSTIHPTIFPLLGFSGSAEAPLSMARTGTQTLQPGVQYASTTSSSPPLSQATFYVSRGDLVHLAPPPSPVVAPHPIRTGRSNVPPLVPKGSAPLADMPQPNGSLLETEQRASHSPSFASRLIPPTDDPNAVTVRPADNIQKSAPPVRLSQASEETIYPPETESEVDDDKHWTSEVSDEEHTTSDLHPDYIKDKEARRKRFQREMCKMSKHYHILEQLTDATIFLFVSNPDENRTALAVTQNVRRNSAYEQLACDARDAFERVVSAQRMEKLARIRTEKAQTRRRRANESFSRSASMRQPVVDHRGSAAGAEAAITISRDALLQLERMRSRDWRTMPDDIKARDKCQLADSLLLSLSSERPTRYHGKHQSQK